MFERVLNTLLRSDPLFLFSLWTLIWTGKFQVNRFPVCRFQVNTQKKNWKTLTQCIEIRGNSIKLITSLQIAKTPEWIVEWKSHINIYDPMQMLPKQSYLQKYPSCFSFHSTLDRYINRIYPIYPHPKF